MTVAELIEKLQRFDPALPVVVSGFDSTGHDPLESLDLVDIVPVEQVSHGPAYVDAGSDGRWVKSIGEAFRAVRL